MAIRTGAEMSTRSLCLVLCKWRVAFVMHLRVTHLNSIARTFCRRRQLSPLSANETHLMTIIFFFFK